MARPRPTRQPHFADALVVAAATTLVFTRAIFGDFVLWDDNTYIFANPGLRGLSLGSLLDIVSNATRSSSWYTPLATLRLAVLKQFFGLDPAAFHASNVMTHALCAGLLVLVLHSVLQSLPGPRVEPRRIRLVVAFAALLWSLHPLRVEAVAWASPSYDLALFFALLSTHFHLMSRPCLSAASLVAALLSQPAVSGWVFAIAALDWWRTNDPHAQRRPTAHFGLAFAGKGPHVVLTALVIAINAVVLVRHPSGGHETPMLAVISPFQAARAIVDFSWWPFAPWSLELVRTDFSSNQTSTLSILCGLALMAAIGVALLFRKKHPAALALIAAHVALALPVCGLFEKPYYPSDRYASASSLVLSVALALYSARLRISKRTSMSAWGPALAIVAPLSLLILALVSIRQIQYWEDTGKLLRHALDGRESDPNLAYLHWRLGQFEAIQHSFASARSEYAQGLRLAPEDPRGHAGLLELCSYTGKPIETCYAAALPRDAAPERLKQGRSQADAERERQRASWILLHGRDIPPQQSR